MRKLLITFYGHYLYTILSASQHFIIFCSRMCFMRPLLCAEYKNSDTCILLTPENLEKRFNGQCVQCVDLHKRSSTLLRDIF